MDTWIDEAEARGRKEGEQKSLVDSVRSLMKTMNLTPDERASTAYTVLALSASFIFGRRTAHKGIPDSMLAALAARV